MILKTVDEIENLRGKRTLLRLDLNISISEGEIGEAHRLERSLKTLNYLRDKGAKVIIISHIGPGGEDSLAPIAKYLKIPIFDLKITSELSKRIDEMAPGEAIMLENIRRDEREKKNDATFARELSSLGDIFVNEAFSASHREHTSIVGIPKFLPSYFGFLFKEEVENLSKAFLPEHPFIFILGGAKLETKLPLIEKFLGVADKIFIGGATANSILKNLGYEVGMSLAEKTDIDIRKMMEDPKIVLPHDFIVRNSICNCTRDAKTIEKEDNIMDVGPEFLRKMNDAVSRSKFILWNGPLGFYEEGYDYSTIELAKTIALADTTSIVGGGDTVSAIKKLDFCDRFSFISTGGGAMLLFLAKGTLPGIEAIVK